MVMETQSSPGAFSIRPKSGGNVQSGWWYALAMERLVEVVQELSHARDLNTVVNIVREAARALTGSDGASVILRDGDNCYHVDESAITPLWKGQRFPMQSCISGWSMLNAQPAVVEDIATDPRTPAEAYSSTFIKSLVMVPIRKDKPIGAIGNYWARKRKATEEEVSILQALADVTSVAMENVDLYTQLQAKLKALEESHEDLNCFVRLASDDLKAPLKAIHHLAQLIDEDPEQVLLDRNKERLQSLRERLEYMEKFLDYVHEYVPMRHRQDGSSAEEPSNG